MEVASFSVPPTSYPPIHMHFGFSFKEVVQKKNWCMVQSASFPRGNLPFFGWSGVCNLRANVILGQASAIPM